MISIRRAEQLDLATVVLQAEKFLGTFRCGPYDPGYMPEFCLLLIDKHLVLMAMERGNHVGTLAACRAPSLFDPTRTVWQELAWWIEPGYRAQGVGAALLTEFERIIGDDPALLCTLPTTEVEVDWFVQRGWRLQQSTFSRNM